MKHIIHRLTAYNVWANQRITGLLREQPDAVLQQEIASSFPSIRKTAFHIWDAEHLWLKRLHGERQPVWPSKNFAGTMEEAYEAWASASRALMEYAQSLSEEQLLEEFDYQNTKGEAFRQPRYEALLHVVNHSTYHRGQLITMLREAGVNEGLPATDLIVYLRMRDE